MDAKLRFLDAFVNEAVANGAKRYVSSASATLSTTTERYGTRGGGGTKLLQIPLRPHSSATLHLTTNN